MNRIGRLEDNRSWFNEMFKKRGKEQMKDEREKNGQAQTGESAADPKKAANRKKQKEDPWIPVTHEEIRKMPMPE